MENTNEYNNHIRAFASLLHNKGYLGDFALLTPESNRRLHEGLLHDCLRSYISNFLNSNRNDKNLLLQTYAQYLSPSDYKQCSFYTSFQVDKGFTIEHMEIQSMHPDQQQRIAVKNNNDIPGKNAILGRFRKPKPWERMARGDFGFKKRR